MRHIVITSIHPPNKAIEGFAAMTGESHVVVAGDLKSPSRWEHPNCTFLDVEAQKKLPHRIVEQLPWNHYGRKMLGYLHAIGNGATEIMDTDDDNVPYPDMASPRLWDFRHNPSRSRLRQYIQRLPPSQSGHEDYPRPDPGRRLPPSYLKTLSPPKHRSASGRDLRIWTPM